MCPEPERLKPELERVQSELDARLAEACERHGGDESTGELIKLEEILTEAADAAKEAISIRRRLGAERAKDASESRSPATERESDPGEGVREFADANGRTWQVWEVPPEQLSARRPGAYAGDYQSGWLAFESADGKERRRLPRYPRDWRELPVRAIESLCVEAEPVTRSRRGNRVAETRPDAENSGSREGPAQE